MLLKKARLGLLAIIALVSLRFVIGYHFYMEGAVKVREGNFSSKGFLAAAKGPLADYFHQLIPDFDGLFRLPELREGLAADKQKPSKEDPSPVLTYEKLFKHMEDFGASAASTYGFTEEQKTASKEIFLENRDRLNEIVAEWSPQIAEYLRGYDRVVGNKRDDAKANVAGLRKQKDEIETKWRALAAPVLSQVDRVLKDYEASINSLATESQIGKEKRHADWKLPGEGKVSVAMVDKYLPIFDMSVGLLLMLGLLTPLAGIAAGLFLASVVLTQFPGSPGSQPTYYQAIEMIGCFVLAFADAGRYAGLDFLPWSFWNRNSSTFDN